MRDQQLMSASLDLWDTDAKPRFHVSPAREVITGVFSCAHAVVRLGASGTELAVSSSKPDTLRAIAATLVAAADALEAEQREAMAP